MPSTRARAVIAVGLAVKPVGKPDAGNPHVRFDERGRETGCCRMAQATAPVLDSTRFMHEGADGLLRDKTRPPGKPRLPDEAVQRVLDLTLSEPPGDATHWTGRMMAK